LTVWGLDMLNLVEHWVSLYPGTTAAIRDFNQQFGKKYRANVVYQWLNPDDPLTFPVYAQNWARTLVIPHIAEEFNMSKEQIRDLVDNLV